MRAGIGAHVSVSKGYVEALSYARSVGCECLQFFAKSPRQWRGPVPNRDAADAFIAARAELGFGPVFTHTTYLINLSTTNEELREKSIAALADEIVRGAIVGAAGVVTHIGNDPGDDRSAAAARAGEAVARAFDLAGDAAKGTRLLLENTAGAGSTFGGSMEELAAAISHAGLSAEHLGVCIDTCHAFAYGYGVDTAEGWSVLAAEIADSMGSECLGLIHANDCMFERGSHRDRHAWIGDGLIGSEGFRAMFCEPLFAGACVITEMPGEVPEKDEVNNARLRALREECSGAQ